ncbi:MAG: hypothetical protein AAF958_01450 [Planctomycetota bacterium]
MQAVVAFWTHGQLIVRGTPIEKIPERCRASAIANGWIKADTIFHSSDDEPDDEGNNDSEPEPTEPETDQDAVPTSDDGDASQDVNASSSSDTEPESKSEPSGALTTLEAAGLDKRAAGVLERLGVVTIADAKAKRDELGGDLSQINGITKSRASRIDEIIASAT